MDMNRDLTIIGQETALSYSRRKLGDMAEIGMDAIQVRDFAGKLEGQAAAIAGIIANVNRIVDGLAPIWVGKDAHDFAGWWASQHRPALQKVQDSIHGLSVSARNNADDQDRASGVATRSGAHAGASTVHAAPQSSAAHPTPAPLPKDTVGATAIGIAKQQEASGVRLQAVDANGHTWNQPGQCMVAVQTWVNAAGGHFVGAGNGGPLDAYANSHAQSVPLSEVQPGDVLQRVSTADPNSWNSVHTVLVTAVHANGSVNFIQTNAENASRPNQMTTVTERQNVDLKAGPWTPSSTEWLAFRF
jgi:uncharacterized protein YukE